MYWNIVQRAHQHWQQSSIQKYLYSKLMCGGFYCSDDLKTVALTPVSPCDLCCIRWQCVDLVLCCCSSGVGSWEVQSSSWPPVQHSPQQREEESRADSHWSTGFSLVAQSVPLRPLSIIDLAFDSLDMKLFNEVIVTHKSCTVKEETQGRKGIYLLAWCVFCSFPGAGMMVRHQQNINQYKRLKVIWRTFNPL